MEREPLSRGFLATPAHGHRGFAGRYALQTVVRSGLFAVLKSRAVWLRICVCCCSSVSLFTVRQLGWARLHSQLLNSSAGRLSRRLTNAGLTRNDR